MKKWLMLAFLPLLLAQQEAGAGIFTASVPGDEGYTALFDARLKTGSTTLYDYLGISIKFGSLVLLDVAKQVEQNGTPVPNSPLPPFDSLIKFSTYRQITSSPPSFLEQLRIVNLYLTNNPITSDFNVTVGGKDPITGNSLGFDLASNTLTAYKQSDAGFGMGTCIRFQLQGSSLSSCIPLTTTVPVADSLLLVGIGLMALRITSRRLELS